AAARPRPVDDVSGRRRRRAHEPRAVYEAPQATRLRSRAAARAALAAVRGLPLLPRVAAVARRSGPARQRWLERAAEEEAAAVLREGRRDVRALGALASGAAHDVEDAARDERDATGGEPDLLSECGAFLPVLERANVRAGA